jgi:hypothetical protein
MSSKRLSVEERATYCRETFLHNIMDLLLRKGADYGGSEGANSNFDNASKDLDLTKYQIWSVYFHKHLSALKSWITRGKVESENITSRIDDMITYLFILRSMIEEDEKNVVN